MADVLPGANDATRGPYNSDSAQHDQRQTAGLLQREYLFQDHCCQDRDHQWHDAWKQCAPVGSWCEK